MSEPKERKIETRKTRLGPKADQADREFWAGMSPEERVREVWRLTVEQWRLKGWNPDEPGLCRSVARIVRR